MTKQIAIFNHKGGVGKTTTTFNIGWMLAEKGKRVIIVDCDPQCNLTGMVLGYKGAEDFETIYRSEGVRNIRDGLAPAFESRPALIEAVTCEEIDRQPNLYLLPGHIGLAEYEVSLGIAQELSGSLQALRNLPGSFSYLFSRTSEKYKADYILLDMSPSLGPINRNLLMTSDYFVVPMFPDFFSAMAIESLASILPKWSAWARQGKALPVLREAVYPFPDRVPKFLGTIIQNYRVRKGLPASAFQQWFDEIGKGIVSSLIPVLTDNEMLLSLELYDKAPKSASHPPIQPSFFPEFVYDSVVSRPLLQVPDFNSLIARSQEHNAPVFDLTDEQLQQDGVVLETTKKSMNQFRALFAEGADRIIALTEEC